MAVTNYWTSNPRSTRSWWLGGARVIKLS